MPQAPVYLDSNATTPVRAEVLDAMLPWLRDHFGNPSSGHVYGRRTREAIERARAQVAGAIGAEADEIVFTGGGTEASNIAILGLAEARPDRRHVITTTVEHPATAVPCAWLSDHGHVVTHVGVDATGRTSADAVADELRGDTLLVTVMHANNETGALQPVEDIAARVGAGTLMHTDAAQSLGKVPVNVDALGVDLLTIAGHKLYAPKGVGALYVRAGTALRPVVKGAGHERGLRPGTENVAAIAGLGVACELAARELDATAAHLREMRDALWERLQRAIPGMAINGPEHNRLPNTLNTRFPGVSGNAILAHAPDVAASTGSACHEGGHEIPSAVLLAMGLSPAEALGAVRLSTGRGTTADEIDRAATALVEAWETLRQRNA